MRGSRQKVLRARFEVLKGRPSYRTRWESDGFYPSEWRRLKKAYKRAKSKGEFA